MQGFGYPSYPQPGGSGLEDRAGAFRVPVSVGISLYDAHDLGAGAESIEGPDVVTQGVEIYLGPNRVAPAFDVFETEAAHSARLVGRRRRLALA
jgi:hypothetical protein